MDTSNTSSALEIMGFNHIRCARSPQAADPVRFAALLSLRGGRIPAEVRVPSYSTAARHTLELPLTLATLPALHKLAYITSHVVKLGRKGGKMRSVP